FYAAEQNGTGYWLYDAATGYLLSDRNIGGLSPRAVFWSGETTKAYIPEIPWRERTGRQINEIRQYEGEILGTVEGNIAAIAAALGAWREERTVSPPGARRFYTPSIPTTRRRVCLLEDSLYRNGVAQQAMGYHGPPQLSYHFR